jgi:hypothetical protein
VYIDDLNTHVIHIYSNPVSLSLNLLNIFIAFDFYPSLCSSVDSNLRLIVAPSLLKHIFINPHSRIHLRIIFAVFRNKSILPTDDRHWLIYQGFIVDTKLVSAFLATINSHLLVSTIPSAST